MTRPTPTRHASPPDVTETRALVAPATTPDSMSPSRGRLGTTSENTDDMRPGMWSGVTVWLIVERHTALTESAAPATTSSAAAIHSELASPTNVIATAHAVTAQITTRPSLRVCDNHPVVIAATVAPSDTAEYRTPVPLAPA